MNNRIDQGFPFIPTTPAGTGGTAQPKPQAPASGPGSFADILGEKIGGIRFSEHAADRLRGRNLQMTPTDITRLEGAVEMARGKGAKESLVVMNNTALIVSVRNNTVVTAMGVDEMRNRLVTNIDSAVIL